MAKDPVTKQAATPFEKIKGFISYITNSKPFRLITSSAVGRTIGIISTLAVATVATIPAVIIGLGSIAIGAIMDTAQTGNLRRLRKEHSLLIKNRNAKSKQDYLLELEPKLADALKNDLYKVDRNGQKSLTEKYPDHLTKKGVNASSWGKSIFKNSISTVKSFINLIASPTAMNAGKLALSVKGIYGEANKQLTKEQISQNFQTEINVQRDKSDTPGYNDLTELGKAARSQRIQTMALTKLMTNGKYRTSTPEEIRAEFNQIKQDLEKTEAAVKSRRGPVNRLKTVGKSFVKAHNPFSKYSMLDKLANKKQQLSALTTGMEKQQLADKKTKHSPLSSFSKDDLTKVETIKIKANSYSKTDIGKPRKTRQAKRLTRGG